MDINGNLYGNHILFFVTTGKSIGRSKLRCNSVFAKAVSHRSNNRAYGQKICTFHRICRTWVFNKHGTVLFKQKLPLGIAIGSAYAGTDEIHQIFVDGRSCQFTDWALDTAGIVTGAIIFLILNLIIRKIIEHKKEDKKI